MLSSATPTFRRHTRAAVPIAETPPSLPAHGPVVPDHPRCAEIPTHQQSGRSPYATWMPYASRGWSKKRPYHKRAPGGAERQRELKINVRVGSTKERWSALRG